MTIQQIKYVLALDTHRHFVKAAESCFVTQSTLTIQVKKLEDEIGCALFDRSVQPLVPTPMGELFIGKVRRIDQDIKELADSFNAAYQQTAGRFKVGIIPTLAPYLLPLFLGAFLKKHPETHLDIEEMESEELLAAIQQGRTDIGLLSTPTHDNLFREIPLFYEPFLLYCHPKDPILKKRERVTAEQLDSSKIWLLAKGHCFRNQMVKFCELSGDTCCMQNLALEGGSIETLKRMISRTSGCTLIPELSADLQADKDHIRRFEEPEPAREISLVVQKHFTRHLLLQELKTSILKNIPPHFKNVHQFRFVEWR